MGPSSASLLSLKVEQVEEIADRGHVIRHIGIKLVDWVWQVVAAAGGQRLPSSAR